MKYLLPRLAVALALPLLLAEAGCGSSSSNNDSSGGGSGGKDASGGSGGVDAAAGSGGSGGSGGRDGGPQDVPTADGGADARDGSANLGEVGGMVPGPADNHCMNVQTITVSQASCNPDGGGPPPPPAGDAGMEPQPIHNNAQADDDDCKYHVTWTSTPIYKNMPVTFTVTVVNKADNTPVPFPPRAQFGVAGVLSTDDTVVLPNTSPMQMLGSNGTWTFGPVRFDDSGDWNLTFHIREECSDNLDDSPHGHATFLVRVP